MHSKGTETNGKKKVGTKLERRQSWEFQVLHDSGPCSSQQYDSSSKPSISKKDPHDLLGTIRSLENDNDVTTFCGKGNLRLEEMPLKGTHKQDDDPDRRGFLCNNKMANPLEEDLKANNNLNP